MNNSVRHLERPPVKQQQGIVLVFCLVLLLVTTLLGITAMSTTSLEETMTQNERDRHTAFQAAEAALREGEAYVLSQATSATVFVASFVDTCLNGLCTRREDDASFDQTKSPCDTGGISNRWDMWSCPTAHAGNLAVWTSVGKYRSHTNAFLVNSKGITTSPKYIIEFLGYQSDGSCVAGTVGTPCDELYRVTAFATGGTADARVMLQSAYQVEF
ncbi:MAG: hypothetical protein GY942_19500 [Aestuariibacter sp.]|nr:hypothetical protein [Aestuariibacter sp.]